jgi:hypothetical protein
MNELDEYFNKLEEGIIKLVAMGDAQEFINTYGVNAFIKKLIPIIQYTHAIAGEYGKYRTSQNITIIQQMLDRMVKANPSLTKYRNTIDGTNLYNKPVQRRLNINPVELRNNILSAINGFNKMHGYNPDDISSLKNRLKKYMEDLERNREAFSNDDYKNLYANIKFTIDKIDGILRVIEDTQDIMNGISY